MRILMGPGPSNSHPRALAAMALPQLGHMHPPFLKIMDEISDYLRYLMQTDTKYTCAISGCVCAQAENRFSMCFSPSFSLLCL